MDCLPSMLAATSNAAIYFECKSCTGTAATIPHRGGAASANKNKTRRSSGQEYKP
jgi:hypothetical protein